MSDHRYAGHSLAEIKAVAGAATPGPWKVDDRTAERVKPAHPSFDSICTVQVSNIENWPDNAVFIAIANPATILAMAARIEELERIERVANCGTVQNCLSLPNEDKAKWFALTLERDREQCQRIAELESELHRVTTEPPTGTAPCTRFCEHIAFKIRHAQDNRRIEELEQLVSAGARLVSFLRDDAAAISYQTLGQYRGAALALLSKTT